MKLVTVNISSIPIGQPLPYSLRDSNGTLLANKGFLIEKRETLLKIVAERGQLYIDSVESLLSNRAYVNKLHSMVRQEEVLGVIAATKATGRDIDFGRVDESTGEPDWESLRELADATLRNCPPDLFHARLSKLRIELLRHAQANPDATLFALIHLSRSSLERYSATHAMLVCVVCSLTARQVLQWPEALQTLLSQAALTMNIGMTELQDELAIQVQPPTEAQRELIEQHAAQSVSLLEQLGVSDAYWLEAVRDHHTKTPGPLSARTSGQRLARLIQRADVFSALMAPRISRNRDQPESPLQVSYFDENKEIDNVGAAIIKAVGVYPPGSFVRLANHQIAAVIHRGNNTAAPKVAVFLGSDGMPIGEPIVRDTSQAEYKILASVPHADVRVQINLTHMLQLTKSLATHRPW